MMTVGVAPGRASAAVNSRPRSSRAGKRRSSSGVASAPVSSYGSSPPLTAKTRG
jgi:hypothetical protein